MTTCPRCGSSDKTIRMYPYRSNKIQCRNGWHTVGIKQALGYSPLDHQQPGQGALAVVESADRVANRPIADMPQFVLDNRPIISISNAELSYAEMVERTMLDIAKALGVRLQVKGE